MIRQPSASFSRTFTACSLGFFEPAASHASTFETDRRWQVAGRRTSILSTIAGPIGQ